MQIQASSVEDYLEKVPAERKEVMKKLRKTVNEYLPEGFEECLSYGMIGYVVPFSEYPQGYHCDPKLPLPFLSLASQKNFVAVYHMGIYVKKELLDWFVQEYPKHCSTKLDMGKSCIRFKKINEIPYTLIEQLVSKMNVTEWIELYEKNMKR